MEIIALTGHNSVRGLPEALAAAQRLKVIPGVEPGCTYCGSSFHLFGYGFDSGRKEFACLKQTILQQEKNAADETMEQSGAYGIYGKTFNMMGGK